MCLQHSYGWNCDVSVVMTNWPTLELRMNYRNQPIMVVIRSVDVMCSRQESLNACRELEEFLHSIGCHEIDPRYSRIH
jgi:hypothetical protein